MSRNEPAWTPDEGGDDPPVIRHARDHSAYGYASDDLTSRFGGSRFGLDAVVVPRSRRDGRSPAFDPHVAAPVHVDPGMSDGGVVVDLSKISGRDMSDALRKSRYPHQVFYHLARSGAGVASGGGATGGDGQPEKRADDNGYAHGVRASPPIAGMGSAYVVPRANQHGEQTAQPQYARPQEEDMRPVPQVPATAGLGLDQPAPKPPRRSQARPSSVQPVPYEAPPPAAPVHETNYPQQVSMATPHIQHPAHPMPYPPPYYPQPAPMPVPDPALNAALSAIGQTLQQLSARVDALEPAGGHRREPPRRTTRALTAAATATVPRVRRPSRRDVEEEDEDDSEAPIDVPGRYDEAQDTLARTGRRDGRTRRVVGDIEAEDAEEVAEEARVAGRRPDDGRRRDRRLKKRPRKVSGPKLHDVGGKGKKSAQHVADLDDRPRDGIIVGFETLRVPFLTGPRPEKARRRVYFEYPELGKQAANYHQVVVGDDVIVLVYDTRYEDGSQFEPPALGPDRSVLLHVDGGKDTAVYRVASLGLTFSLGCLDMVVLLKQQNEEDGRPVGFEPEYNGG